MKTVVSLPGRARRAPPPTAALPPLLPPVLPISVPPPARPAPLPRIFPVADLVAVGLSIGALAALLLDQWRIAVEVLR